MDFIAISYIPYVLILTIISAILIYKKIFDYNYWKRRGVPFIKPVPLFGNCFDVVALRSQIGPLIRRFYEELKSPFFGIYIFHKPFFIPANLDLIKLILVKDFDYFCDHNILSDVNLDPIASRTLLCIKMPEWKPLHNKFAPFFTARKLRAMSPLIGSCAYDLNAHLRENSHKVCVGTKEICMKYSTEVITSCAFGIKANCFENDNCQFRQMGRFLFDFSWKTGFIQYAYFMAHWIAKLFKVPLIPTVVSNFMRGVFLETMREREQSKMKRNDLIDIILEMKNENQGIDDCYFDDDTLVAQAVMYFAAGFETTGTALCFAFYELALHQDVQNKLRLEIENALLENGELNYETIQDMKYLQMFIYETLRKYPGIAYLDRLCVKDYEIPGTDVVIEKGTAVLVPIFGLHHDPDYFPDPEKFDPERFSDGNKVSIPHFSYLPFGDGPRICTGERFGMLTLKFGVTRVIAQYRVEACESTPVPIQLEPKSFFPVPAGKVPLKFSPIR